MADYTDTLKFMENMASYEEAKKWSNEMDQQLKILMGVAKFAGKYGGPAGEVLKFALEIFGESQSDDAQYFEFIMKQLEEVYEKLDVMDDKLTGISSQVKLFFNNH